MCLHELPEYEEVRCCSFFRYLFLNALNFQTFFTIACLCVCVSGCTFVCVFLYAMLICPCVLFWLYSHLFCNFKTFVVIVCKQCCYEYLIFSWHNLGHHKVNLINFYLVMDKTAATFFCS